MKHRLPFLKDELTPFEALLILLLIIGIILFYYYVWVPFGQMAAYIPR